MVMVFPIVVHLVIEAEGVVIGNPAALDAKPILMAVMANAAAAREGDFGEIMAEGAAPIQGVLPRDAVPPAGVAHSPLLEDKRAARRQGARPPNAVALSIQGVRSEDVQRRPW